MKRRISLILIVMGVLIGLYPLIDRVYSWYWQNKLIESYKELDSVFLENEENLFTIEEDTTSSEVEIIIESPIEEIEQVAETMEEDSAVQQTEDLIDQSQQTQTISETKNQPKPIGILKIRKIGLEAPVLAGATEENLKVGVGWLKETSKIGEIGNAAIAGHRSHTYGRFFNRLNEMSIGDLITVDFNGIEYKYKVYEKIIVEPSNISVLKRNNKDRVLTLITCHPLYVASHRLIIKGKIEE